MRRIGTALLATLVFTGGCYTWHDIPREAVTPGLDVRLTLEREEALRRIEETGDLRLTVTGTAAEQSDERVLGLTSRTRGSSFNSFSTVPWQGIVRIEEKRFSWVRTGGLAAAGLGATIAILSVIEGQTDEGGEGPPINEAGRVRVPLLRIGW